LFSSQLRINMASGVVTNVLNFLILAATIPICLHYLGAKQYGLWLVLNVVIQFAQKGDLGIQQAITKLVAEEYGKGDKPTIEGYLSTAIIFVTSVGAVILILILCFKQQILAMFCFDKESLILADWFLPYIGVLSIYSLQVHVCGAALSGLGRMDIYSFIQTASRVVSLVVVATLLWRGLGILGLYFGELAAFATVQIGSVYAIHRLFSVRSLNIARCSTKHLRNLIRFGVGIFGGSVALMLVVPLTKVLLSRYVGLIAVSVYDIAFRGTQQLRGLLSSGFQALMPEISRIAASSTIQSYHRIRRINRVSFILMLGGGLPVLIFLIYIADLLLLLWLGKTMPLGLPTVFKLFLATAFISLLAVSAYQTLLALGVVWKALMCHVLYVVCYFTFLLVWMWTNFSCPLNGIGWASMCGSTVGTLYILWRYCSEMRKYYIGLENVRSNLSTDGISRVDMVW